MSGSERGRPRAGAPTLPPLTGSPRRSLARQEHPERFVPETMGGLIKAEHEARYRWAAAVVANKEVLDAASGVGYGTEILARAGAARVVGVDRSREAIENARARSATVSDLVVGDLHELPFEESSFDVVVCFEAIEHVERPGEVLDELKRVLRPDGAILLSTPNRSSYMPGNPHHVHEYLPDELEAALEERFRRVALYRQHPWVASLISDDAGLEAASSAVELAASVRKVASVVPGHEVYTLAVAGDAELPEPPAMAVLADPVDLRGWQERVALLEQEAARLAGLVEGMSRSLSWRTTAPLRSAMTRLRAGGAVLSRRRRW